MVRWWGLICKILLVDRSKKNLELCLPFYASLVVNICSLPHVGGGAFYCCGVWWYLVFLLRFDLVEFRGKAPAAWEDTLFPFLAACKCL